MATPDRTIGFYREYKTHEETPVHPALESKVPGITAKFAEDHEEDDRLTTEIEQLAARIRNPSGAQRVPLACRTPSRLPRRPDGTSSTSA